MVWRESLDRRDLRAIGLNRKHQAGPHCVTIDDYGASAAHAVFTGDVGACFQQLMAKAVSQGGADWNVCVDVGSVECKADVHFR